MGLNTFLAVLGLFILRIKKPEMARPYKTWGYPVTPIIFLSLTGWTLVYLLIDKPKESMLGLLTVAIGVVVYLVSEKMSVEKIEN